MVYQLYNQICMYNCFIRYLCLNLYADSGALIQVLGDVIVETAGFEATVLTVLQYCLAILVAH